MLVHFFEGVQSMCAPKLQYRWRIASGFCRLVVPYSALAFHRPILSHSFFFLCGSRGFAPGGTALPSVSMEKRHSHWRVQSSAFPLGLTWVVVGWMSYFLALLSIVFPYKGMTQDRADPTSRRASCGLRWHARAFHI